MKTTLQPNMLQWARTRAGLSVDDLAHKLHKPADAIQEWETSGELTLSQAEQLARATYLPLGYLFLTTPPDEKLPVNDFRTVATQGMAQPSLELLDTVNDALRRQDWYRDYLQSAGESPPPFVGSLTVSNDILRAAAAIRQVVPWDSAMRAQAKTWEVALTQQIERVEAAGILVMRNGVVGNNTHRPLNVSEFRGFALSDPFAPLIFLNGKDAKAAQMFTLAHELVHVFMGVSGVSNLNQTYAPDNQAEQFCSKVAAELLVPLADLRTQWDAVRTLSDPIQRLVRHFKVSSLVILRRLRDADVLTQDEFQRLYSDALAQFGGQGAAGGGGDFYRTLRTRLGQRFTTALVESTLEGRTLYRDAFQLLGVSNSDALQKIAREMQASNAGETRSLTVTGTPPL